MLWAYLEVSQAFSHSPQQQRGRPLHQELPAPSQENHPGSHQCSRFGFWRLCQPSSPSNNSIPGPDWFTGGEKTGILIILEYFFHWNSWSLPNLSNSTYFQGAQRRTKRTEDVSFDIKRQLEGKGVDASDNVKHFATSVLCCFYRYFSCLLLIPAVPLCHNSVAHVQRQ